MNTQDDGSIDWDALKAAAEDARDKAYCPYSNHPVGAAGLSEDGRIYVGCNVENASYVGMCAECGMINALKVAGSKGLKAVYVTNKNNQPILPCGRCRQMLYEEGGKTCLVMTGTGAKTMDELLPWAFGPENLEQDNK